MADPRVRVRVEADDQASGTLSRLGRAVRDGFRSVEEEATRASRGTSTFGTSLTALASKFSVVFLGVQSLARGFRNLVAEIPELTGLRNSLERLGVSFTTGVSGAQGFASAMQTIQGAVSALEPAFNTLGDVVGGAIRELTAAGTKVFETFAAVRDAISALVEGGQPLSEVLAELSTRIAAADAASVALAARLRETGRAAGSAVASTKELADAYAAAVESVRAFGEVTSVQLEAQILEITSALINQKLILGENSAEWQRLREIAEVQIAGLRDRIQGLRDGLGDVRNVTSEAADGMADFGEQASDAASRADELAESNARLASSFARVASAREAAAGGDFTVGPLGPGLSGGRFTTIGAPIGFVIDRRTGQIVPETRRG